METTVNKRLYRFRKQFDVNLTLQYETDRWNRWHIVREFISNALDAVAGDASRVHITSEEGFINIADEGNGFPIVYAKRIGASSSKYNNASIGQFGEGSKMAILSCLRNGIDVRLASQDWLIVPKVISEAEDIEVMVFDIYESEGSISGCLVSIAADSQLEELLDSIGTYFLHFRSGNPPITLPEGSIYTGQARNRVYNKGVYVKDITSLFTYNLSIEELNRDRDIINDSVLESHIRRLLSRIDDDEIIKGYWIESATCGRLGVKSDKIEFSFYLCLISDVKGAWAEVFRGEFGDQAVIYTDAIAAKEATRLGCIPINLEYWGATMAESVGIKKDTDICGDDYEFIWAETLTRSEQNRIQLFRQVASLLDLDCPQEIKVYDEYAKGDGIVGIYDHDKDMIAIKKQRLNDSPVNAVETWIHELNHRETDSGDYDREFADGLSLIAAKMAIRLLNEVGLPQTLKLTNRGFKLPQYFNYSAENMLSSVVTAQNMVIIKTAGHILHASLPGMNIRPYSSQRAVTFYKGNFYINLPGQIRNSLPEEITFQVIEEQIL